MVSDTRTLTALADDVKLAEARRRRDDVCSRLKAHGVNLPFKKEQSPSKKRRSIGTESIKHLDFLLYSDYDSLLEAVGRFELATPVRERYDSKIERLHTTLARAVQASKATAEIRSLKAKTESPAQRRAGTDHRAYHYPGRSVSPLGSPTSSIKHLPLALAAPYPLIPKVDDEEDDWVNILSSSLPAVEDHLPFDAPPLKPTIHSDTTSRTLFKNPAPGKPRSAGAPDVPTRGDSPVTAIWNPPGPWPIPHVPGQWPQNRPTTKAGTTSAATSFDSGLGMSVQSTQEDGSQPVHPTRTSAGSMNYDGAYEIDATQSTIYDEPVIPESEWEKLGRSATRPENPPSSNTDYGTQFVPPTQSGELIKEQSHARTPPPGRALVGHATSPHAIPALCKAEKVSTPAPAAPLSKSPTKNYRLGAIVADGLAHIRLPLSFDTLPLCLQIEAYRVLQNGQITGDELHEIWKQPRTMSSLHEVVKHREINMHRGFEADLSEHSICAKLRYSTYMYKRVYELEFLVPQRQKSNELERRYGRQRFLTVETAPITDRPSNYSTDDIQEQLGELMCTDCTLFGCTWVQFLTRDKKRKKSKDSAKSGTREYHFFATKGPGLEPISICTFLNLTLPFRENAHQSNPKLYARLELAVSRTDAGPTFSRDEIEIVEDIKATDVDDDPSFQDHRKSFHNEFDPDVVMTNGCGTISVAAMRDVCDAVGRFGPLPSAVQMRCMGGKGLLKLDRPPIAFGEDVPSERRITLPESMVKIKHKECDNNFAFNVVGFSEPPKSSLLYTSLLPILHERGVPAKYIRGYVSAHLSELDEGFALAIGNCNDFRRWIYEQDEIAQIPDRHLGINDTGGFPVVRAEKMFQMLESGFEPKTCKFLADEILASLETLLSSKLESFKIPCSRSFSLMGVPDWDGVLEPGEVHINFSQPWTDPVTGHALQSLAGFECLATRHPASRESDLQKLRIVHHPKLVRQTDCIIFSTRGRQSEADKMQGGDFDGDRYWVTIEPLFVKPFRNAPAPRKPPPRSDFFIDRDERTFGDIVPSAISEAPLKEAEVRQWLRINTRRRMAPSYLGIATIMFEKMAYHSGTMTSEECVALCDLRDYLIDGTKNGDDFGEESWRKVKAKLKIVAEPSDPAYWQHTKSKPGKAEGRFKKMRNWNRESIVDQVYLIFEAKAEQNYERAKELLSNAQMADEDLTQCYKSALNDKQMGSPGRAELEELRGRFTAVREKWRISFAPNGKKRDASQNIESIRQCRKLYQEIQPTRVDDPVVRQWMQPHGNDTVTLWDLLKASAFFTQFQLDSLARMVFNIAGTELCRLKAPAVGRTRTLTESAYLSLKPAKRKGVGDVIGTADLVEDEKFEEIYSEKVDMVKSPRKKKRKSDDLIDLTGEDD